MQEVPPGLQSLSFASTPGSTAPSLTDCASGSGSSCKLLHALHVCHAWTASLQLQLATCLRDPHLVAPKSCAGSPIACQQNSSLSARRPDGRKGATSAHIQQPQSTCTPLDPTPFTSSSDSSALSVDKGSATSPLAKVATAKVQVAATSAIAPVHVGSGHVISSGATSEDAHQPSPSSGQPGGKGETAPHQMAPRQTAPHQTASDQTAPHQRVPHQTASHQTAPHQTAPRQPPAAAVAAESAGAAPDACAPSDAVDRLLEVLSEAVAVRCVSPPASSAATTGGSNEIPDTQQARRTSDCSSPTASGGDANSALLPQSHQTSFTPHLSASAFVASSDLSAVSVLPPPDSVLPKPNSVLLNPSAALLRILSGRSHSGGESTAGIVASATHSASSPDAGGCPVIGGAEVPLGRGEGTGAAHRLPPARLCILFSGGVDSTLIAALAHRVDFYKGPASHRLQSHRNLHPACTIPN